MYRTIDAAFWTDPKVRKLEPDGKLLFLYFITNPHTHVCGLYYVPRIMVKHETGLSDRTLDTLCHTLSKAGLCRFDSENELVWVVQMFKYQGSGSKNYQSAARHISEDVHHSPLITEFCEAYPVVKPFIKDRVSYRVSEFGTPEQEQEQEQNTEQEKEQKLSLPSRRTSEYSEEFERFWKVYPRKEAKGEAWRVWKGNGHPPVEDLIACVQRASVSAKWQEEGGRFIPHPATWLNQKRWDDEPPKSEADLRRERYRQVEEGL